MIQSWNVAIADKLTRYYNVSTASVESPHSAYVTEKLFKKPRLGPESLTLKSFAGTWESQQLTPIHWSGGKSGFLSQVDSDGTGLLGCAWILCFL